MIVTMPAQVIKLTISKGYDSQYWHYTLEVSFLDAVVSNEKRYCYNSYDEAYKAAMKVRSLIETLQVPL